MSARNSANTIRPYKTEDLSVLGPSYSVNNVLSRSLYSVLPLTFSYHTHKFYQLSILVF